MMNDDKEVRPTIAPPHPPPPSHFWYFLIHAEKDEINACRPGNKLSSWHHLWQMLDKAWTWPLTTVNPSDMIHLMAISTCYSIYLLSKGHLSPPLQKYTNAFKHENFRISINKNILGGKNDNNQDCCVHTMSIAILFFFCNKANLMLFCCDSWLTVYIDIL